MRREKVTLNSSATAARIANTRTLTTASCRGTAIGTPAEYATTAAEHRTPTAAAQTNA
jgi:hypothetical protein